jgi:hypothetical protein
MKTTVMSCAAVLMLAACGGPLEDLSPPPAGLPQPAEQLAPAPGPRPDPNLTFVDPRTGLPAHAEVTSEGIRILAPPDSIKSMLSVAAETTNLAYIRDVTSGSVREGCLNTHYPILDRYLDANDPTVKLTLSRDWNTEQPRLKLVAGVITLVVTEVVFSDAMKEAAFSAAVRNGFDPMTLRHDPRGMSKATYAMQPAEHSFTQQISTLARSTGIANLAEHGQWILTNGQMCDLVVSRVVVTAKFDGESRAVPVSITFPE